MSDPSPDESDDELVGPPSPPDTRQIRLTGSHPGALDEFGWWVWFDDDGHMHKEKPIYTDEAGRVNGFEGPPPRLILKKEEARRKLIDPEEELYNQGMTGDEKSE